MARFTDVHLGGRSRSGWTNLDAFCSALLAAFEAYGTALCGQVPIHPSVDSAAIEVQPKPLTKSRERNAAATAIDVRRGFAGARRGVRWQH
ncbi:MAG TPA: hypothetical protein VKR52_08525 [Terracidiphilus sp.]|nr:hypothetical protein [Terracidiphilus sp.]